MENEQTFEKAYTFYVPFDIMEKTFLGVTGAEKLLQWRMSSSN